MTTDTNTNSTTNVSAADIIGRVDNLLKYVENFDMTAPATANEEEKIDATSIEVDATQVFEKSVGCEKQPRITLTTVVDENRTNVSEIPAVGFGTWLSRAGKVETAVECAVRCGYRHIDCAAVYGNEVEVGVALKKVIGSVVTREELFITSKLWNSKHDPRDVIANCKKSLADLGLEYVDLYLIHWPMCLNRDGNDAKFPKLEDGTMDFGPLVSLEDTWGAMEEVVKLGLAKHIGISNFNSIQTQRIVDCASIQPAVNQMESHPYLNQTELMKFCADRGVTFEVYSPLGNPGRPAGWDHSHPQVMENETVVNIANAKGVSPAAICVRFQIQRGNVVLVKSVTPSRIKTNLELFGFELSEEEMAALVALNCGVRYGEPTVINKDGQRVVRDIGHAEYPFQTNIPF